MFSWIGANLSTILISIVLIAIVTFISLSLIRQKRQGKSSCGGNCAHCGAIAATPKGSESDLDRQSPPTLSVHFLCGAQYLNKQFRRFFTESSSFFREPIYNGSVSSCKAPQPMERGERKPTP